MTTNPIYNITVIGCGMMGSRIAGCFAYYGHCVNIYDLNEENVLNERFQKDKNELFILKQIESYEFKGKLKYHQNLKESIENSHLIIECIPEYFEDKVNLLRQIDKFVSNTAIVVTNTINFDINALVDQVDTIKDRFIGARFLYPVYFIPEVEIRVSKHTRMECVERLRKILGTIEKKIVLHSDSEPFKLTQKEIEFRKEQRIQYLHREKNLFNQNQIQDDSEQPCKKLDSCSVCLEKSKNCLMRPCNHLSTCFDCAKILKQNGGFCPICRSNVTEIIKVYIS